MGALEDLAKKIASSGKQNQHRTSYTQTDPVWEEYMRTNERVNPEPIGLESPGMLDPLDPFMLKGVGAALAKVAKPALRTAIKNANISVASGTPRSQRGSVGIHDLDDGTIYDYLPKKIQNQLDFESGVDFEELAKRYPKQWGQAVNGALYDLNQYNLRNRYFNLGAEYVDKLPKADKSVIVDYVAGSDNRHAYDINSKLRKGVIPEQAELIDQILRNAPRADEPFFMYRGQPVDSMTDPAFLSVTKSPEVARTYANSIKDLDNTLGEGAVVKLALPPRTPLVSPDVKDYFMDQEMLLPRGLKQVGSPKMRSIILPEGYKQGGLVQYCNCKGK